MKKVNLVAMGIVTVILIWVGYQVFFLVKFFYFMRSQMEVGTKYMDSITEKDIPVWIERTNTYLKEYISDADIIGVYGVSSDKPIPNDLKALKIIRIDIGRDFVDYVWLGGMDHTCLEVRRMEQDKYRFTAHYNDCTSKVIWPKQETIGNK